MRCPVFRGIGGTSFKYYCLFQHHTAPPLSTYTTDDPATMTATKDGTAGADPRQLQGVYVYERPADDPSWIVGPKPGPYVEERSRSLYMRLGKRMAICGIDARTERTRRQVNYPETYDLIFDRLHSEFAAARGQITHLILLLGIPIAYPRLAWLENVLKSPLIAPIKLLNKRFGLAGGFFNHFDGKVDLLDDLDDHYTAKLHKPERKQLILRLQEFSKEFSVRVTILGGDVHLGALGRFYSAAKLGLPAERDHRYMANIISSAITNKPPPAAVANLLARRNKIHHLHDDATDETLLQFFDKQPGGNMKSASFNHVTMPSRNFATITEVDGALHTPQVNGIDGMRVNGTAPKGLAHSSVTYTNGHSPLHWGEENAGTKHPAADGFSSSSGMTGGLDVSLRVEIDHQNKNGATEGYGFSSM
jgi:PhoD related phosphatase